MSLTNEDKQWISEQLTAIERRFAERLKTASDETTEFMRGVQTELLRGFHAHSEGFTIRLRKVEVDQSNLDAALSKRVEILERRLFEIETKLDHTR